MLSRDRVRFGRRLCQILFFSLFIWLLLATFYQGLVEEGTVLGDFIPYPVSIFLNFDPLAALATLLATGSLFEDFIWSLAVILITIFMGRIFCGWFCPLGALSQFMSWTNPKEPLSRRISRCQPGGHQKIKYALLAFFLGGALFGMLQVGLLDPICLLVRSLGLSILPALDAIFRGALGLAPADSDAAGAGHRVLDDYFLGPRALRFHAAWIVGVLFLVILFLNRLKPRFFCRVLCPLGALLGLLSRFSLFTLRKDAAGCNDCGLCTASCQGGASPEGGTDWKSAECVACFNCTARCPQDVLGFGFFSQVSARDPRTAFSRRGFLASALAGAIFVPLSRRTSGPPVDIEPLLIRPPGSCDEEDFLSRCIKCGQCMKVCPNNAVHPASYQGGLEGIWTPVIIPRIGYCEPSCTLCSQVCPTGAIRAFTVADKEAHRVNIGTAVIDVSLCLPWARGTPCMVCEEFCPVSPKAIWFEKASMPRPDGAVAEVQLPRVEPSRCTGCGGCETACPLPDRAAIRITSCGESRSSRNQVTL